MQTVPSLIASGTAIAAAATGLVFGQPAENYTFQTPRQTAGKRKASHRDSISPISPTFPLRPGTTGSALGESTADRQQHTAQLGPNATIRPRSSQRRSIQKSWRRSSLRQSDAGSGTAATEEPRDSLSSSNSSWIRRLSIRPMSQHESVKSSLGPDSPSVFSYGSGQPIFRQTSSSSRTPNKLVKRSSANHGQGSPLVSRGSRSQMPTLRRPATSHQRSATLHQLTAEVATPPASKFSHDSRARPRAQTLGLPAHEPALDISANDNSTWRSFFHARIARIAARASPISRDSQPGPKRICLERASSVQGAYLVSPRSVLQGPPLPPMQELSWDADVSEEAEESPQNSNESRPSLSATPSKTPKRSMSMHFSSPTNWISRSGSLRRRKRCAIGTGATDETLRQVSDPTPTTAHSGCPQGSPHVGRANSTGGAGTPSRAETDLAAIFQPPHQRSNSPLPSLSRLSSFHMDLSRMGSPTNMTAQSNLDSEPASSANPPTFRVNSNVSHSRTLERASTVASSDYHRGFTSGDDDDTDFKTDTPYDSLRTAGSGCRRTLDSPVESMFDESPPSTAGNNKPKRLSIQEILGPTCDGGNRIMEEDESLPTPVGATFDEAETHFRLASLQGDESFKYAPITPDLPRVSTGTDFSRLSFDEDDALDWAREDEHPVYNHLSPPSSMNSRGGSPSLRMALASITGNAGSNPDLTRNNERPRSNIFDWAETAQHDKLEGDGHSSRPKTVHGKQALDMRGGRIPSRKGPVAAHIRSQSVPAVQDIIDNSKPKFGTWGLGSKNVSEDWDEDFEFEEDADAGFSEGVKTGNRLSMVVPASIAATQPTVKAHSGQIRELSLLVNDLKRLCRLGREMDMLSGSSATLWREAEGIIALASPDEDDADTSATNVQLENLEPQLADDRFIDEGFDGSALEEQSHRGKISDQMKTAVVKERPAARRRSVFSPEDDIFGTFQQSQDGACESPSTPDTQQAKLPFSPSSVARSLMESMQLRRREPTDGSDDESANGRLNFDTNSLKELVKRAGDLRDSLSDIVRKADRITQTPARTPRRDRSEKNEDGSPAFTRVFNDPSSSPAKRIPHSHSSSSVLNGGTINTPSPNGLSQRLQMMTVN
ncbi:uncharacterized protein PG986_011992 [Apiospora aurea]|uniref:Uncharacterized protein n=1 Tax=Apiospora aurea TaxID=335848 RepID=A0ABR1PZ57_9PEZI